MSGRRISKTRLRIGGALCLLALHGPPSPRAETSMPDTVCVPPSLSPTGTALPVDGKVTLSWSNVGAVHYNVRLDDGSKDRYDDPKFDTCKKSPHYFCENNVEAISIEGVRVQPSRTYTFWVDPVFEPPREYCNGGTQFEVSSEHALRSAISEERAVQLFMDPDGEGGPAARQTGAVESKFRGDGFNAAAFLRRAIAGNTGAILPSAMVADLSWDSSADSCTLFEEVKFLGRSTWPIYSGGDYFSPVIFSFPDVPGTVSAIDSVKAVIPIRYMDTAGVLVDFPYETEFTLECDGVRSNTITATFAPADIRKSDADFTAEGGVIVYPSMIKGPVVKADIKAATSYPPIEFSDESGVSCMNTGGGAAISCNLMVLWSSLNATECTISGLGYSSAYDWGVTAAFGYQNTASVYLEEIKQLTCRNDSYSSTGISASDSVTVPFP